MSNPTRRRRVDKMRHFICTISFIVLTSYKLRIDKLVQKMSDSATLSTKFQISIPKAVRQSAQWSAGQKFVFIPKGKGVLLMPVPRFEELRGLAKGADPQGYRDRQDRY
jgi:AbrB family looped-hinge helix DNA binding protein